jgi:hypothetical protein
MPKESDRYEVSIAEEIDKIKGLTAVRPVASVHYSDVKVKKGNLSAWVEVKMASRSGEYPQIVSTRFNYNITSSGQWGATNSGAGAKFIVDRLNSSTATKNIVKELSEFTKIPLDKLKIPTTSGDLKKYADVSPSKEQLKKFLSDGGGIRGGQYIFESKNIDMAELAKLHYITGKTSSADYIQLGDNFFRMTEHDAFKLTNVPMLNGKGNLLVRFSIRSSKPYYEIQPEAKFNKNSIVSSKYSFHPGTKKLNPFFAL